MASLVVLVAGLALFRVLGWTGVEALDTWQAAARAALALMFVFTGVTHFTPMRHDFARMVPPAFAQRMAVVYFTGVCEILGALGLLIPGTRRAAGLCLALLLVAMFPANIRAARHGVRLGGRRPAPLPLRAAMQTLYIALAVWSTRPL
jgi:uncharacterized membrane protein